MDPAYTEQSKQHRTGGFVYQFTPDRYTLLVLIILFFIPFSSSSNSVEIVHLQQGFNLFSYPSEPSENLNCTDLQSSLDATQLSRLNSQTQLFEHCSEMEFPVYPGSGYVLDLATAGSFEFEGVASCPVTDLVQGLNLIGIPTPAEDMSCYDLLETIGNSEVVSAIQYFNATDGRYQSCYYDHLGLSDIPMGTDFSIIPGVAYWVSMLQARQDLMLNDESQCEIINLPEITSINPPGGLPGQIIANFTVEGNYLLGSVFNFVGDINSPITVTSTIINIEGTSATMSIAVDATANGLYTVKASNDLGSSNDSGLANTFRILDPAADEDHDGLTNAEELALGTDIFNPNTDDDDFSDGMEVETGSDPLDPASFPVDPNQSIGEVISLSFSMLNTVNPGLPTPGNVTDSALFVGEATSLPFSILNTVDPRLPAPGESSDPGLFVGEAASLAFSILNTVDPGLPAPGESSDPALIVGEAASFPFSVLNTVNPGEPTPGESSDLALFVGEATGLSFSILNTVDPGLPAPGDSTDQDLFVGEAISSVFSVETAE